MEEAAGSGTAGGQSKIRTERAGASCQNCAPAFFTFTGSASFSVGLSAWRSAVSSRRYGNAWFRSGRRKQIIRTHLLSEKGSDYIGLVRVVIQHFSKNTVISMVLGHPNSEITCIRPLETVNFSSYCSVHLPVRRRHPCNNQYIARLLPKVALGLSLIHI